MDNFVVTFARGFGTGGKAIASQLAKELGIHCYENRILTLASQLSGLDENVFQEVNEKLREEGGFTSFLRGLPRAKGYISRNEKFKSDDRLFEYQSQIINELADKESCVIIGRCADYALEDNPFAVSVWIKADLDVRIQRIKKLYDLSDNKAADMIQKTDKRRASYYNYYSSKKWGEAKSYDLCLDSGELGIDGSIELILKYIELKEKNLAK